MTFDPTKPCQTRSGVPVRILCTDGPLPLPVIAVKGSEVIRRDFDGKGPPGLGNEYDIINVPDKTVRFLNIGKSQLKSANNSSAGRVVEAYGRDHDNPVPAGYHTVKLTLEEGVLVAAEVIR